MDRAATSRISGDGELNREDESLIEDAEIADGKRCAWDVNDTDAGSSSGRAFIDAEDNLKFYPPLYRQRYETVRGILKDEKWAPPVETVVEFGCAELAMFPYFKQIPHITKVFMVDIDSNLIDYYSCRTAPLTCDYLDPRPKPLHVEVLCGSVADCDNRLLGANAVVCIELIEHLQLDIVEKLEETIFGFIEPEIAIFTTPNSDFNVLLKGMQGKFRHYDHKFEWSRSEFLDWTNKVISAYPHYRVEISGVGEPPVGSEDVGYCSQLALFIRSSKYIPAQKKDVGEVYATCKVYDHPSKPADTRSETDKLQDEVQFRLMRMGYMECYAGEDDFSEIPLLELTVAVQTVIPTADMESIRSLLPPEDIFDKDGNLFVKFDLHQSKSDSNSDGDLQENYELTDEEYGAENYGNHSDPDDDHHSEELWDIGTPIRFTESSVLAEYHMTLATFDNATNLVHERQAQMDYLLRNWTHDEDSDDDDRDDDEESYSSQDDLRQNDCERMWNSSAPPKSSVTKSQPDDQSREGNGPENNSKEDDPNFRDEFSQGDTVAGCSNTSPLKEPENPILDTKCEPITDSGFDLSPLLNLSYPQEDGGDTFPCNSRSKVGLITAFKRTDIPKSTSVEVLHLDGSCTLKRRAGLEYVEFAPSTSVALCYTGQTYCEADKVATPVTMSMSSERKSLDSSLVRDVADSCSLDFAGDSGYPNSSSLHHDVDVDLTPEQVDDISSENGDRSNQSLSEDELSDSSDRVPALPRRMIHPRRLVVPIVFENVENGDLANNNRDGEGNNAVAPLGDEREFIALVQEGEMQPLLAAPVADDVVLPNDADPFPVWLMDLLRIDEDGRLPAVKMADELEKDEGLGEDAI